VSERAVELFLANQGLIGFVIRRYFGSNPPELKEEMFDEGRLYLWQAALTHDEAKGAFATWAVLLVRRGIIRWLNSTKTARRMQAQTVSLDTPIAGEDDDLTLADTLEAPDNTEVQAEARETLEMASRSRVGRFAAKGYSARRIAKRLKRSLSKVKAEQERLRAFARGEPPPTKPPAKKSRTKGKLTPVKRPKKERERREPSPETEKTVHDLLAVLNPQKSPLPEPIYASQNGS
jgi:RNA polymerase sigma factor (sigma-70 family)